MADCYCYCHRGSKIIFRSIIKQNQAKALKQHVWRLNRPQFLRCFDVLEQNRVTRHGWEVCLWVFFRDFFVIQFIKSSRKGYLWFKSDNLKLVLETLFCKTRGKRICITRNSNNKEKLLLAIPLDYTRNVSFQTWISYEPKNSRWLYMNYELAQDILKACSAWLFS